MNSIHTITSIDETVKQIFECQRQVEKLEAVLTDIDLEMALCQNLTWAIELFESLTSKS